ncbi:hypothetical protein DPEC_G00162830 [Dallia pectoralis]|uniref:Uncharacterized protein n=1 Tax=Dallia pectoralis TaxID=75939 RepID=A0ACC2GGT6_DALPE|nr:hypothetical protein DPEC_G00162830 [Dallia pectoralis]
MMVFRPLGCDGYDSATLPSAPPTHQYQTVPGSGRFQSDAPALCLSLWAQSQRTQRSKIGVGVETSICYNCFAPTPSILPSSGLVIVALTCSPAGFYPTAVTVAPHI